MKKVIIFLPKGQIEYKTISYIFGVIFLWFSFGIEVEIIGGNKNEKN